MLSEIKELELKNVDLIGKTVKEVVELLENNGTRKVKKGNMYVENQNHWSDTVKDVTYHNGYGFKQVDAVLHI